MITPWILSNRSIFPTTYHKHTEGINTSYTLVRSSQGNEAISERNSELIGEDVEADFILFWVNCVPVTDTTYRLRFAMNANLGGSLPDRLRNVIASKQVGFLDMLSNFIRDHPNDLEDAFN